MKLSFDEIRAKHLTGVQGVLKFLEEETNFDPYLVESDRFQDFKFARLCQEYSNYKNVSENSEGTFYRNRYGTKNVLAYKKIVDKYTQKQYVETNLHKNIPLDHLYHGDIMFKHPCAGWGPISMKVTNSHFLRRYPISRFKGQYVVFYNPDDVSMSRVAKKTHIKTYLESICTDEKWKKMPKKKKNSVFQNFDKFENFCTLGEFATIYIQHAIITEDDDFSRTERKFFVKRDHNVREFR